MPMFPASLRDTLLRLAEIELFDPHWSDRILEEVRRNVVESRTDINETDMDRLAAAMNGAFEDALVDGAAIAQVEDSMENDPKDRHVLAAAVVSHANSIVTSNVRDFPPQACEPYGVTVTTADEFLCVLFEMASEGVRDSVIRQAAALQDPPHTAAEVLDHLERTGAPSFAERVREALPLSVYLPVARAMPTNGFEGQHLWHGLEVTGAFTGAQKQKSAWLSQKLPY